MTAMELAIMLNAKRIRRGQWMAKCPVHKEDTPSLSIRDMGNRMSIRCFGCGAKGTQVMEAMGLHASDLFIDTRTMTPELRGRLKDEYRLERLKAEVIEYIGKQYFFDASRSAYWRKAEERALRQIQELQDKLYPEGKIMRERKEKYKRFIAKHGHDKLWELFLASEKGAAIAAKWGREIGKAAHA